MKDSPAGSTARMLRADLSVGWYIGVEPMTSRATIWRANQLRQYHHIKKMLARQEGLEPPTYCLEGSCSIQLSYWRIR